MEQNLPAQDSIVSVNNQNLKSAKPKRKIHIPKIAILIVFFIVLLILMEGGLYLAKKSNPNSNPNSTPVQTSQASPTPDPMNEWEITYLDDNTGINLYKNKALGYSFKAPINWNYTFDQFNNALVLHSLDLVINKLDDRKVRGNEITVRNWKTDFNTPQEYIDNYWSKPHGGGPPTKPDTTKLNIDGIEALQYDSSYEGSSRDTIFIKNGQIYVITVIFYTLGANDKYDERELSTYQKLISSFKFIDSEISTSASPTCIPRPSCLDSIPACKIPITEDMCPPSPNPTTAQTQKACTLEAKLCPDGVTSVGRSGPNCEFEKCPGE